VIQYPDNIDGPWEREAYIRNSIQTALKEYSNIKPQDEIIISDIDEIPDVSKIEYSVKFRGTKLLGLDLYHYHLNMQLNNDNAQWIGPVMSEYKYFTSGNDFRRRFRHHHVDPKVPFWIYNLAKSRIESVKYNQQVRIIPDAGWHFSYLGDIKSIVDKIESFKYSQSTYNKFDDEELDKIEKSIKEGKDLFDIGRDFKIVDIDDNLPDYIINNKEKFSEYFISDNSEIHN
jgi:beta-1,4-mannosyl-glycoprotein beta-1,4-N-acetylglucosaminyltransferase